MFEARLSGAGVGLGWVIIGTAPASVMFVSAWFLALTCMGWHASCAEGAGGGGMPQPEPASNAHQRPCPPRRLPSHSIGSGTQHWRWLTLPRLVCRHPRLTSYLTSYAAPLAAGLAAQPACPCSRAGNATSHHECVLAMRASGICHSLTTFVCVLVTCCCHFKVCVCVFASSVSCAASTALAARCMGCVWVTYRCWARTVPRHSPAG